MTVLNKIKLISIMLMSFLVSIGFIFCCIKIALIQDGTWSMGFAFLGAIVGTSMIIDLIFKPLFTNAYLQHIVPKGHDWEMIDSTRPNQYRCKECGIKIMFDLADINYVEAVHSRIGYYPDSKPTLLPITLKDVRSCEEIRMDDALG